MKTVVKIVVVCFALGMCFAFGGVLAGVAKLAPKGPPTQIAPTGLLLPITVFCVSVGSAVSYLVLRSSWYGLKLAGALFVALYGISTIATQVESLFFLSTKMPRGLIAALFVQGAIAMALFVPLAVLILGKWRPAPTATEKNEAPPLKAAAMAWRIPLLVVVFVFLYLFFGYFVAWRNPALRAYYGGTEYGGFFESLKNNWERQPHLYLLQVFRALLYLACVYPLLRMLRVVRWKSVLAIAAFLASWTTALLLPNPLMPANVARSHFVETLAFNLMFGALAAWLMGQTGLRTQSSQSFSQP